MVIFNVWNNYMLESNRLLSFFNEFSFVFLVNFYSPHSNTTIIINIALSI